jgi:hypothetical protein
MALNLRRRLATIPRKATLDLLPIGSVSLLLVVGTRIEMRKKESQLYSSEIGAVSIIRLP